MEHEELLSVIEAILFAAGDPVPASRIALVTGEETQTIVSAARELAAAYEENRCGMRLVQMNDLLQLCSAPEYAESFSTFFLLLRVISAPLTLAIYTQSFLVIEK